MPSMYSYFAPLVSSDEEVWARRKYLSNDIADFESACASVGLKRGLHYSMIPLSKSEISDVLGFNHTFPIRVPLIEVKFRSKKYLDLATTSGIATDANGDETERAIWGP